MLYVSYCVQYDAYLMSPEMIINGLKHTGLYLFQNHWNALPLWDQGQRNLFETKMGRNNRSRNR